MSNRRSFLSKVLAIGFLPLAGIAKASIKRTRQSKNVVVTLYVHTATIDKPNESNYCNFGQPDGVSNENFTTEINLGDTVTWQGMSLDSTSDVVNIVSINYQGGKNVFGKNVLQGDNGSPQKVRAQPTLKTAVNESCKYAIQFTVTNNGAKRNGTFKIDPVIQVH
ncbi:MAG: hypothetical protein JST14_15835 [Bacteroidetes bacterium]|nr:hypothetical protein [Bacteroidota bacterium]MBS1977492.1 hypothetical protein [Bacteroidota bacterium]